MIIRLILSCALFYAFSVDSARSQVSSANGQETVYGSVDDWTVMRMPREGWCGAITGHSESLFGITMNANRNFGVILSTKNGAAASNVYMQMGLSKKMFDDKPYRIETRVSAYGQKGREVFFQGPLNISQASAIFGEGIITFVLIGDLLDGNRLQIHEAHSRNGSRPAQRLLSECAETLLE